MKRKTRTTTGMAALICVTMTTIGCAGGNRQQNDPMALNAGVTDVSAVPPAAPVAPPEPVATPVQPVVSDAPTQAPAPVAAAPAAASGGKYTVQRGDTLWKIATATYGDGKQWQRIAGANPGLSPSTLKAGQTIVIP